MRAAAPEERFAFPIPELAPLTMATDFDVLFSWRV
jgi:hypothetical protein